VSRLEAVTRRPIMYFRPAAPGGGAYLRVTLNPGGNFKKAAGAVDLQRVLEPQRFRGSLWPGIV
jgi:hypothetical protein